MREKSWFEGRPREAPGKEQEETTRLDEPGRRPAAGIHARERRGASQPGSEPRVPPTITRRAPMPSQSYAALQVSPCRPVAPLGRAWLLLRLSPSTTPRPSSRRSSRPRRSPGWRASRSAGPSSQASTSPRQFRSSALRTSVLL